MRWKRLFCWHRWKYLLWVKRQCQKCGGVQLRQTRDYWKWKE